MIELFGGTCVMSHVFAKGGWQAESFELSRAAREDVTNPKVVSRLLNLIKGQKVDMVWIGIPCSSWTRARRAPPGSRFPQPLRGDAAHDIWGLPNLGPKDKARVAGGNATARVTARVASACEKHGVPCVIENPATSRLWLCPPLAKLGQKAQKTKITHCAFGSCFMKPTMLWSFHLDLSSLPAPCRPRLRGKRMMCSYTGAPHHVLEGTHRQGGFNTAQASAYPTQLCTSVRRIVVQQGHEDNMMRVF